MHVKSVHMHMSHESVCHGMSQLTPDRSCSALARHLCSGQEQQGPRKVAESHLGRDLISMEISCAGIRMMMISCI